MVLTLHPLYYIRWSAKKYSIMAIKRYLEAHKYTSKKVKKIHARRDDEEVAQYWRSLEGINPWELIFLDESHVTRRDMNRPNGWAIRGERAGK